MSILSELKLERNVLVPLQLIGLLLYWLLH